MSRTIKDRPFKVRMLENLKRGEVFHNHENLGKTHRLRRTAEYTFLKRDAKDIREFRQELTQHGYEFETYEKAPVCISDEHGRPEYTPRKVVFLVTYDYRVIEYSAYCTDYEHYDPELDVDIRDGKTPACTPKYSMEDYGYRSTSMHDAYPQNASAMKLQEVARLYNNGADVEELEDTLSGMEIDHYFKPGHWYYD